MPVIPRREDRRCLLRSEKVTGSEQTQFDAVGFGDNVPAGRGGYSLTSRKYVLETGLRTEQINETVSGPRLR